MVAEFDLIKTYFKPLSNNSKESQGLQDDVARIAIKDGYDLVVSKDISIEDVHFKKADGGFNIANKLLKSNLSDLAAAGADPLYYMLGFSKPKEDDEVFIKDFYQGLKEVSEQYKISLIGGDTIRTKDKLFFSITIFGQVKKGLSLNRNNAQSEDLIFTSGTIGDAFIGLSISNKTLDVTLNKEEKNFLLQRHLNPTPQIELGKRLLQENLANSAIDISDGLLADLNHICQASKLGAVIYQDKIPISISAKSFLKNSKQDSILDLISGGDDYELIFTALKKNEKRILELSKKIGVQISNIGYLDNSTSGTILLDRNNKKISIKKLGYQH